VFSLLYTLLVIIMGDTSYVCDMYKLNTIKIERDGENARIPDVCVGCGGIDPMCEYREQEAMRKAARLNGKQKNTLTPSSLETGITEQMEFSRRGD